MNQNDTLVELRDIFANVLANASFSVLQDLTTCKLFRATRFPETTSRFAPYEFFSSSSRHLLERRTCVESVRVRADMLARSCMMTRLVC